MGDDSDLCSFDIASFEQVIKIYPDHPFIKYAYFGLAIELCNSWDVKERERNIERGIRILEMLMKNFPKFRPDETRIQLAKAHLDLKRYNGASELCKLILSQRPWLQDNNYFMKTKVRADTKDDPEAIASWELERMKRGPRISVRNSTIKE